MKTAIHVHTYPASPCAHASPQAMLKQLIAKEYQAVFLTEHDVIWEEKPLQKLQRQFPEILILPGLEKTFPAPFGVGRSCHVLVLGADRREFLQVGDPHTFLRLARKHQYLSVIAHPFRWEGPEALLRQGHLPDALEAYTLNHDAAMTDQALAACEQYNLPDLASDDAHTVDTIGNYWLDTRHPFSSAAEFREMILAGEYENRSIASA